jgi:hypothetical protein
MAGDSGHSRLIFGADSKIRYIPPFERLVRTGSGSKVTVFSGSWGNLAVGYAGLWTEGLDDDLLHNVLTRWEAASQSISELCNLLAREVAQPLTRRSFDEGFPNLSEFLVGYFPLRDNPSLHYVSSGSSERVPVGVIRAIGGDPRYTFTQRHLPPSGEEVDRRFLVDAFARDLTRAPSDAYDYPLLVVEISGPAVEDISRQYVGQDLLPTAAPAILKEIPRPLA